MLIFPIGLLRLKVLRKSYEIRTLSVAEWCTAFTAGTVGPMARPSLSLDLRSAIDRLAKRCWNGIF